MTGKRKELQLIIVLSVIVGLSLVGQLGMSIVEYLGVTLLPIGMVHVILRLMFWLAFALTIFSIFMYGKLFAALNKNIELKVLASLGLVIAIAHVGQFAVTGLKFVGGALLPGIVVKIILYTLLWTAFLYVFAAIYMYKKL